MVIRNRDTGLYLFNGSLWVCDRSAALVFSDPAGARMVVAVMRHWGNHNVEAI